VEVRGLKAYLRGMRVSPSGGQVQLSIVALNFIYAIFGVILMWLSYRAFDMLTRDIHFANELKQGNIAVAIFIASIFISIALIIGHALN
jgi:uncharacterized membrane protein YjfL (UPF0719 family)